MFLKRLYISLLLFFVVQIDTVVAQDAYQLGVKHYEARGDNLQGLLADPQNINKAIVYFIQAYEEAPSAKLAEYVARSYYFKGTFALEDEIEKQQAFEKGKEFGMEAIKKYPNAPELLYWHAVNYATWGQTLGLIQGLREDVLDSVIIYCNRLIKIAPSTHFGGGHRILGILNYKVPYIPLILSWPDQKESEKHLKAALAYAPSNWANNFFYAEFLYENDRGMEARKYIDVILSSQPRKNYIVEDRWAQIKVQELLDKMVN